MLHDEIISNWKKINDTFNTGTYPFNSLDSFPRRFEGQEIAEGDQYTLNYIDMMQKANPAVFYLDEMPVDMEFINTAIQFYREGILKLPFEHCMFICRKVNFPEMLSMKLSEAELQANEFDCAVFLREVDGDIDFAFLDLPNGALKNSDEVLKGAPLVHGPIERHLFDENSKVQGAVKLKPLLLPNGNEHGKILRIIGGTISIALQACLCLSMPHYAKEGVEISEKLNKARQRAGKPPLKGYTTVKLRRDIRRAMEGASEAAGYAVKPHWRRGHIRTYASGLKVPVRPCMVNWEGDVDLEKNTYLVKG